MMSFPFFLYIVLHLIPSHRSAPTACTPSMKYDQYLKFIPIQLGYFNGSFNLISTISATPASFGQTVVGDYLQAEIVSANPMGACSPLIGNYTGKIVQVDDTQCFPTTKAQNVYAAGGILMFLTVNSTSTMLPTLQTLLGPCTGGCQYIPSLIGQTAATPVLAALKNYTTVQLIIPGTGPIDPVQLDALIDIATTTGLNASLSGGTRSWDDLRSKNVSIVGDPCLNRVEGIWCINGSVVDIYFTNGGNVTGHLVPSIGLLSSLQRLNITGFGLSDTLPCEIGNLTSLRQLAFKNNLLTSLNSDSCWQNLTSLIDLDLSYNLLLDLPDFSSSTSLATFNFAHNQLTTLPNFSSFKNLTMLLGSFNSIQQTLPIFRNLTKLINLYLDHNNFTGIDDLSLFTNLSSLKDLNLKSNQIVSPLFDLTGCTKLSYLELSQNSFYGPIPPAWGFVKIFPDFCISDNQITNPVAPLSNWTSNIMDMSRNNLTALNGDVGLFLAQFSSSSTRYKTLFFDGNQIAGPWISGNIGLIRNIDDVSFRNNKITSLPSDLWAISWYLLDVSMNNLQGELPLQGTFPVQGWVNLTGNPNFTAITKPYIPVGFSQVYPLIATANYLCPTVTPPSASSRIQLDPSYYHHIGCTCDQGLYGNPPNCLTIPSEVTANTSTNTPWSDAVYGNSRFQIGMDIAVEYERLTNPTNVRVVEFLITINRTTFNSSSDRISIYEGDAALSGNRIFFLRGTDNDLLLRPSDVYYDHNNTYLIRIFDSVATLEFQSRDSGGEHFTSYVSFSDDCPPNFISFQMKRCRLLSIFNMPLATEFAVALLVVVGFILIGVTTFILWMTKKQLVIKAASPLFCLLMLFGLALLDVGAIFYIFSPKMGRWVCDLRTWALGLSVVLILANLFIKTHRIKNVFFQVKVQTVKLTDRRLLGPVILMIGGEVVLLGVFSGLSLSLPEPVAGSGSDNDQIIQVYECTTSGFGYWLWFIFQFAYVSVFLLWGSFLAFYTRNTPSAFNEATHILGALLELVLLAIVLIPINFLISDYPEGLLLIRGLGQTFAAITLLGLLFGPKLYYIFVGRGNDQTLVALDSFVHSSTNGKMEVEMLPVQNEVSASGIPSGSPSRTETQPMFTQRSKADLTEQDPEPGPDPSPSHTMESASSTPFGSSSGSNGSMIKSDSAYGAPNGGTSHGESGVDMEYGEQRENENYA